MTAPAYFFTKMKYGTLMQAANAFNQVRDDLSWFVDSYSQLATWKAVANRLTTFNEAMDTSVIDYAKGKKLQKPELTL